MAAPRKIKENFIATVVDDEVVLIDMAGGELFSLKGTARAIWDMIDGRRSYAEIADAMAAEYDVAHSEALADIETLGEELRRAKLLEP
ncbi:PqqD family protein [Altererythrobacter sp. MF3-039]|uniref:PqqD family protein n=1 Tax=Altererythrobacter sp. MF3-039 TaxID=3252901 RepID=UPI00390CBD68